MSSFTDNTTAKSKSDAVDQTINSKQSDAKGSELTQALGDQAAVEEKVAAQEHSNKTVKEFGGPSGPEPTRYGDWERKGRCVDF